MNHKPHVPYLVFAALITASFAFLNYWQYSALWHAGQLEEEQRAMMAGAMAAPWQYRVLPALIVSFATRYTGITIRHAYGLLDACCLVVAVTLLCQFASQAVRLTVPLVAYYLFWNLTWYGRPDTLPATACVVTAMFCLFRGPLTAARLAGAVAMLIIAPFIRADIGLALSIMLLAAGAILRRTPMLLGGVVAAAYSMMVQYVLAAIVYPDAHYDTAIVQLANNLLGPRRWIPFLLCGLPMLWTSANLLRRWSAGRERSTPAYSVAIAAVAHVAMAATLGNLEEVRILLPFCVAISPFTAAEVERLV